MLLIKTDIPELVIIEPKIFKDGRGSFLETYHKTRYADLGLQCDFVQDNLSVSMKGVLRGLHFQNPQPQIKLVSVLHGEAYDVAVDVRLGSPTFGKWASVILTGENNLQFYIPAGFAHGFMALKDHTILSYKCSDFYNAKTETSILWNEPMFGIEWPINSPLLSDKDIQALRIHEYMSNRLPVYKT